MSAAAALSSRRIAITGAGRGLGRALAITAADQGAEVVLLGRSVTALRGVSDIIGARTGRHPASIACDLSEATGIARACAEVLSTDPVLDVLINNGAPWLPGGIEDTSDADIGATVAAAVTGTILITKALLPALRRSAAADIVTIASTAALPGRPHDGASGAFHAAKHGQAGFSDWLRAEVRGLGIRVSALYPPDFDDTDPLEASWTEVRDPAWCEADES